MPARPSQRRTAEAIHRRTGRTFHLATRVLPPRARDPTHVLYAFFRVADEIVDDPDPESTSAQRRELESLRAQALGRIEPEGPVMRAFETIREEHALDDREIETFLDAMAMDLSRSRYGTRADLEAYMRGSAVAVAHLLCDVFAPDLDPDARPRAAALAEAFQLTNFLRDVREDVRRYDRIYLPRAVLKRHGAAIEDVEALRCTPAVAAAIESELERTEERYREGVRGIEALPEDVQFGVLLAAVLYAEHHRLIRRRGYDTLSSRPSLSRSRRLAVAARTWAHWRRSRDPETVFEGVSAVPSMEGPTEPVRESACRLSAVGSRAVASASVPSESIPSASGMLGRLRSYFGSGTG